MWWSVAKNSGRKSKNAKRSTTLEHLGEDAVLTGTVKNLTDYGRVC